MKKFFFMLFATVLFAGCANRDMVNETTQSQNDKMVITVEKSPVLQGEVEGASLFRTSVDVSTSPMHTYWSTGDMIGLREVDKNGFAGNNSNWYEFSYNSSPNRENVAVGSFTNVKGNISDGDYVAVYPYNRERFATSSGGDGDMHFNILGQIHVGNNDYSNFGSNAFMYSSPFPVAKKTNDLDAGFDKESSGIYFNHATAFLVFNLKNIPAGTILYHIYVKAIGSETLWRTTAITPEGTAIYVNPTPAIKLFADIIDVSNGYTVDNMGTYEGGMVVNPGLSAGGAVSVCLRTNNGSYGFSVSFPNGIVPSYYYPINASWSLFTKIDDLWNGVFYTTPHIAGTNILVRSADELRWVAGVCNGTIPEYDMADIDSQNGATSFDFSGYTITLMKDIDLNGKTWEPIGISNQENFGGTFDGGGHRITNFGASSSLKNNTTDGIFDYIQNGANGGHVKNLFINGSINPYTIN